MTAKKPRKEPFGRPRIEIDWEVFDKLCLIQCTLVEIASWFNCSDDTIETRVKEEKNMTFSEYYKTASAKGKASLRRKQFEIALAGNVGMLIWLGKQTLNQTDKADTTVKVNTVMDDILKLSYLTEEQREAELARIEKLHNEQKRLPGDSSE